MWQVSCACVASDLWPVWQESRCLCGTWMVLGKRVELLRMRSPVAVVFLRNNLGSLVFKTLGTLVSKTVYKILLKINPCMCEN